MTPSFAASDFQVVIYHVIDCLGYKIAEVTSYAFHQWKQAGYKLVRA